MAVLLHYFCKLCVLKCNCIVLVKSFTYYDVRWRISATCEKKKNKSYVGLTKSYVGDNISYVEVNELKSPT